MTLPTSRAEFRIRITARPAHRAIIKCGAAALPLLPAPPLSINSAINEHLYMSRLVIPLVSKALTRPFHIWVCGILLLSFAVAKMATFFVRLFGYLPKLPHSEAAQEYLMLVAGMAELASVFLLAFYLSPKSSCQLIASIGATFLVYRFILNPTHCPCMGAAPMLLPWLKVNEQIILLTVPAGLLLLGLWGWACEVNRVDPPTTIVSDT